MADSSPSPASAPSPSSSPLATTSTPGDAAVAAPSAPRIRKAFVMAVDPTKHEEYKARHDALWPDLHRALKDGGAHNYSIFLHPVTSQLFAYVEIEDEDRWAAIARTDACQRWWAFMGDIMPHNADNSPVATELREVFHLP